MKTVIRILAVAGLVAAVAAPAVAVEAPKASAPAAPEKKKAKAAHNHAAYLPARRDMMQVWADYLDAIEAEASAQ